MGRLGRTLRRWTPRGVRRERGVVAFYRGVVIGLTVWSVVGLGATFLAITYLERRHGWSEMEALVAFLFVLVVLFPMSVFLAVRHAAAPLVERLEELRLLRAAERETVTRLEELDRVRVAFLAGVSHELRTPLTVLHGAAKTLEQRDADLSPEQRRRLLASVGRNADRLRRLLEELLDVERLSQGIIAPRRRPVDLAELLRELAARSGCDVAIDVAIDRAVIDRGLVERILDNLVTNAVKYAGGVGVEISAAADDRVLVLRVADRGPGVPDAWKERIFEPLVRRDVHTSEPGTGVGLSLVAEFTRLHGGDVTVHDRPGGGAVFEVRLPGATAEA